MSQFLIVSGMMSFYHAMLHRAHYCYSKSFVCLFKTLRYRNHRGWNYLKIISWSVSLNCSLSTDPNITHLLQREIPQNFGQNRGGVWKKWVFVVLKHTKYL